MYLLKNTLNLKKHELLKLVLKTKENILKKTKTCKFKEIFTITNNIRMYYFYRNLTQEIWAKYLGIQLRPISERIVVKNNVQLWNLKASIILIIGQVPEIIENISLSCLTLYICIFLFFYFNKNFQDANIDVTKIYFLLRNIILKN